MLRTATAEEDPALEHPAEERAKRRVSEVRPMKSRTRVDVKNGVIIEPSALTWIATPASRAASARPDASARPSAASLR
jgi:hypothetical protein